MTNQVIHTNGDMSGQELDVLTAQAEDLLRRSEVLSNEIANVNAEVAEAIAVTKTAGGEFDTEIADADKQAEEELIGATLTRAQELADADEGI